MNRKRVIAILVVVAVVGAVSFHYLQNRSNTDHSVIRVSGNIEVTDAELSFKIAGRVAERLVSEGETVKKGQVVARLDSTDLEQEVELRKAEVEAAKAVLAELEAGSRREEIQQAEAALARAIADAELRKAEYARYKDLFEQEVVSKNAYDAAEASYEMAQARVREAKEALTLLRKGPRIERIDQARAQLTQAEQALALAQTRLGYATLVSPINGLILSENVEAGEYVTAGTPIVTAGEMEKVWLRAYIDETDLGRVKVGQQVRVTTDTYPGKVYQGRISFISSEAEFTPRTVQTEKERVKLVYRIKVDTPNPNMELKPGMPADAEIIVGSGV